MPPRGRPKKGLRRMDAAFDAMRPYGFAEGTVRKVVKELLREYGGDDGWPFIEDCSYKELLEAILRDVETDDLGQVPQLDDQTKGQSEEPSNGASGSHQESIVNSPLDNVPVPDPTCPETISTSENAETEGNGWKDILPDQTMQETASANPVSESQSSPKLVDESPALPSSRNILSVPQQKSRRRPCYGWIENDVQYDLNDFLTLEAGRMLFRAKVEESGARRVRKSRWDVKPDDYYP